MTWFVRMVSRDGISGERREHVVRVPGDSALDFLDNDEYRWKVLERMMDKGSLIRVDIDYRPSNGGMQ